MMMTAVGWCLSVVTWRRVQMVLLLAQSMNAAAITKVAFTKEDRSRCDLQLRHRRIDLLYPRYKGGRPPKFTMSQRRESKKIAKSRAIDHGLPFSTSRHAWRQAYGS
jgi:hypothetical protein